MRGLRTKFWIDVEDIVRVVVVIWVSIIVLFIFAFGPDCRAFGSFIEPYKILLIPRIDQRSLVRR